MSVWLWVGYGGRDEEYILFLNLRLRIKPGENKNVRGKACFAGEGEGGCTRGGRNFLVSIFNVAINLFWGNSTLMMIMMRMILSFLAFVWQPREGTEGQCFALLYGSPRSHLTSHPLWILLCRDLG